MIERELVDYGKPCYERLLVSRPERRPEFFSGAGTTYDNFFVDGCAPAASHRQTACRDSIQYDPLIPVCGGSCISWSYVIRAIEAQQILLQAAFFDENGLLIDTRQVDITCGVSCQFSRQEAQFIAPCSASEVQLSLRFNGNVTACTFYAPRACIAEPNRSFFGICRLRRSPFFIVLRTNFY